MFQVRNEEADSCLEIAYVYSMSSASGTEKRISLGHCQMQNFTRLQVGKFHLFYILGEKSYQQQVYNKYTNVKC